MKAIITDGEVKVQLTERQEEQMLQLAANAYAKEKAEQEALQKVYVVGPELEKRLQMHRDSIYDAIYEDRLRVTRIGQKKGY